MGALLISLLVCLAFINSYGNPVSLVAPHGCEEIRIDLCKSLPYNSTLLPNSFEQDRQTTVNRTLWDLVQRINAVVCSDDLIFFFCSLYLPICVKSQGIRKPIKPCRSVCEKVKRDCRATLESLPDGQPRSSLQLFPEFQCDKLEDYDKGVCLKPEAFVVSTRANSTAAPVNTKPEIKKEDFLKAKFDFAIKGKILSMNQLSTGYDLWFNVSRVIIKNGFSFRGGLAQIWSQTNSSCYSTYSCTYLQESKEYVILGHRNGTNELTLGWAWAWPRDKHLLDKLKLWKAESRRKNSIN